MDTMPMLELILVVAVQDFVDEKEKDTFAQTVDNTLGGLNRANWCFRPAARGNSLAHPTFLLCYPRPA